MNLAARLRPFNPFLPCPGDRGFPFISTASLPATCGELVQGTLDGEPCLVSCPIDLYNFAEVRLTESQAWEMPEAAPRAAQAFALGWRVLGLGEVGAAFRLRSPIPRSRGYGSSTADLGAGLYALAQAAPQGCTAEIIAQLCVGVEPTDSTILPGLSLLAHRTAAFSEYWGPAPNLAVVVLDPGGSVDTLAFNRLDQQAELRALASHHQKAFTLLKEGISQADPGAVGAAATLSAIAHQRILFNPLLEQAIPLVRRYQALGICRAHSGTLVGLLFDPETADLDETAAEIKARFSPDLQVRVHRLVNGGPH